MRNMIKHRLAVAAITFLALTGASLVNATPAQADSTCPTGNLCMWTSPNELGTKRILSLSPGTCVNMFTTWDNNIESFWNHSSSRYYVFTNYNCSITPATKILEPGVEYLVLQSTFANTVSSIQRAS